jgi:predicted Na+-dependent transporter
VLSDTPTQVAQVGLLAFVVAGMAAMGLGLTLAQIAAPLRDVRLVASLLVVNFVVVPAAAVAAGRLLPMDEASATAVILIGCVAGAPFLPKLAQLAGGDRALAVGSMVLLMVLTVLYAPLVVPLVVEGATVSAGDIASSLVLYMLLPLALGLVVRARYPQLADSWVGPAGQVSSFGLVLGIVAAVLVTWQDILGSLGSWLFVGTAIVLVVGLVAGYLAGAGRATSDRQVLALATAQRNIAAALVVASSLGGDAIVRTLVAALVIPIVLITGRRDRQAHRIPRVVSRR